MKIPYGRQTIDESDIKRVVKTLRSAWITQGPVVLEFERKLAKEGGAKYAIAVCNGTAALHLAYLTAGLKKDDEVITTPNTFAATSNMLLAVGAKPVFCDIRLDTYNIDEKKIEKLITKKTRAIVCVDFAGQPCEYDVLAKIAKRHKLILIADASHSLGAKYRGRSVGSLAHMTTFSFHPVKSLTTGEGGAVLTDNKKYYDRLRLLRNHGIYKDKAGKNVMVQLGYNYRITDIQAALGISQLERLDKFIRLRNQVVKWYEREFAGSEKIILPQVLPRNYSAWHIYVIRVRDPKHRQGLWQYLVKKGVGANFHYPAVYTHPYYQKLGYGKKKLPNEELYSKSCVTLPLFPALKISEVRFIASCIKEWIK